MRPKFNNLVLYSQGSFCVLLPSLPDIAGATESGEDMKIRLRRACSLLLALAAGTALAAKPLVYCADATPEGFDPALWDSASTNNVSSQIFQGLTTFKRGGTEVIPSLADSWTVSPDGKTITFNLRKDVRFHTQPYFTPTRPLNADDVVFTVQRWIDPQHLFNKAFSAQFIYPQNLDLKTQIAGVEKIDQHTVRVRLSAPNAVFLSYFAMAFAGIQSAEYADQLLKQGKASEINNYPIGTGPFKFRSYKKDDSLRLDGNTDFWGNPQKTDKLIFIFAKEPNVRVQKLKQGECNITSPIRDVDITALEGDSKIVIKKIQALNISYLSFNMKKPPTDNRLVREALDIAVDRDALFKVLFPRGDATQAVSAYPPSMLGYNTKLKNEYNPERAKELLKKAGFASGFDIDLWALPVVRPHNPNGQLMAQMIQQDWAKIGVKASIKTYEWGEYLKRANNGEHSIYMSGWAGDNGDPDDFLAPNLTCAVNKSGVKFCNKEFDELVEAGRATIDVKKRISHYEKAQEIFKRERPWITIAHSAVYIPMSPDVEGFIMAPNGGMDFENVYRK